ncbi:hypothetical protein BASA50_007305 [Batrachochytrium salamandrivorans]|uniref:Centrosomal protein of 162 kDa n=1 Tax=Batrachochytrium salamandrivorans TaxID=1357716 RepID=A0ABQ8F7D9_9FUNG|nr:hypothetical protein BASA50_007305 [Batrachochytrium salamandrivorans]
MTKTTHLQVNSSRASGVIPFRRLEPTPHHNSLDVIASGFDEDPFETSESDTDSLLDMTTRASNASQVAKKANPTHHQNRPKISTFSDMGLDLEDEIETCIFGQLACDSSELASASQSVAKNNAKTRPSVPKTHISHGISSGEASSRSNQISGLSKQSDIVIKSEISRCANPLLPDPSLSEFQEKVKKLKADCCIKDKEIASLRKEIIGGLHAVSMSGAEDTVLNTPSLSNISKDAKIIELSKKARRLTVVYEREKSINLSLQNQLKKIEQRSVRMKQANKKNLLRFPEIKILKDKIAQVTRKLEEERISSQGLKADLRLAQKALVLEIGEDLPIQKIVKGEVGGWKGRAEQIALLKDKIKDLSHKLSGKLSNNAVLGRDTGLGDYDHYDQKNRESIHRIESTRQSHLDKTTVKLEKSLQDISSLKSKYDAVVARNKTLEMSVKDYKSKIGILLKKGENDDHFIKVLQQEAAKVKIKLGQSHDDVFVSLRSLCADQVGQIQEQSKRIHELELDVLEEKNKTTQAANLAVENSTVSIEKSDNQPLHEKTIECDAYQTLTKALQLEISALRSTNRDMESKLEIAEHSLVKNALPLEHGSEKKQPVVSQLKGNKLKTRPGIETQVAPEVTSRLMSKIDVLVDENDSLKASLQTTSEAKRKDLDFYRNLLDTTRAMFEKDIQCLVDRIEAP